VRPEFEMVGGEGSLAGDFFILHVHGIGTEIFLGLGLHQICIDFKRINCQSL